MARKKPKDDTPKGGWLGPPSAVGLAPRAELVKGDRMKPLKLTRREKELHKEFQRLMKKADAKGIWKFKWPPKN